jgi:pimeloyl-ACP methyl ester carboxylesterase
LVLLHGIGSGAASWRDMIDRLAASGRRVIAWNAPGYHGTSPAPIAQPVPADYAARLAAFLDALGLVTVDLVGHSLGTLQGASFAAANPHRVGRLALVAPSLGQARLPPMQRELKLRERIDPVQREGLPAFARARAARLLSPGAPDHLVARVRDIMGSIDVAAYVQASWLLAQGDMLADAPRITCPTLVMVGLNDVTTPPAQARELAGALARSRYAEIPDAAHMLYLEQPDVFANRLTCFLSEDA